MRDLHGVCCGAVLAALRLLWARLFGRFCDDLARIHHSRVAVRCWLDFYARIWGCYFEDFRMSKPHNPPAFPLQSVTLSGEPNSPEPGMSLRDWFAGQALAGITSALSAGYIPDEAECMEAADAAYRIAGAMLAARKEPTP